MSDRRPKRLLGVDAGRGRGRWMVWHPRAAQVLAMIEDEDGCPFGDPDCPACLELRARGLT